MAYCCTVAGDAGGRGCAAVRVHDQVAVRGAHGLSLPALAGHRHARHPGPAARGAQHHRDAGPRLRFRVTSWVRARVSAATVRHELTQLKAWPWAQSITAPATSTSNLSPFLHLASDTDYKSNPPAEHHGAGAPAGGGAVHRGHQRAVRVLHRAAGSVVPLHQAAVRQQAAARRRQQGAAAGSAYAGPEGHCPIQAGVWQHGKVTT